MITLIASSFLAGVLTVLTPCTLPLLPVVLGGSLNSKSKYRSILIISSLALSVFLFTLILKTGLNALIVDDSLIRALSGLIILALGLFNLYPKFWEKITNRVGLTNKSNQVLYISGNKKGVLSAILTGFALGPVFSSCSPMFGYILFAILPLSFAQGVICLLAFILGMSIFLMLITVLGQRIVNRTKWAVNPNGNFRKFIGFLFIAIGFVIILRIDKSVESFLLEQPIIQNILLNKVEQNIINSF